MRITMIFRGRGGYQKRRRGEKGGRNLVGVGRRVFGVGDLF